MYKKEKTQLQTNIQTKNNSLTKFARNLRKNSSDAERRLWFLLRDRRLQKYKFRRQHLIEPYIVDFVCLSKRLVIELDGGQHMELTQAEHDETRSVFLASKGFKVIRFWNDVVFREKENVMNTILRALESD